MASLSIGTAPVRMTVILSRGSDFNASFEYIDPISGVAASWPVGSMVTLKFDDSASSVWSASISGQLATFAVPGSQVSTLLSDSPKTGQLWINNVISTFGPVMVVPA